MKLLIGLVVAVGVGIACRWFEIPLPGPPAILGATMAVAMASGYTATDHWLARQAAQPPVSEHPLPPTAAVPATAALHRDQEHRWT